MFILIAAAGSGRRMGANRNKLLLPLAGKPILSWTLQAILDCPDILWVGLTGQNIDQVAIETIIAMLAPTRPVAFIEGGITRQESVSKSLTVLPAEAEAILIHDGARCLIEPELIKKCTQLVKTGKTVIAATPVTDTIKTVDINDLVISTPNRSELWAAQTPQGFFVNYLRKAHSQAISHNWDVTDDASIYDRLGWPVQILRSNSTNLKITTKFDLLTAEAMLTQRHRQ